MQLPAQTVITDSELIFKNFEANADKLLLSGLKTVALYSAMRGEVQTTKFFEYFSSRGITCAYPRVAGKIFHFHKVQSLSELKLGTFQILEPPQSSAIVHPDLLFVPGVAFDEKGHRLGYGGGFYDRFISGVKPPAATVALAYDLQVIAELPHEKHDKKVSAILTQTRLLIP